MSEARASPATIRPLSRAQARQWQIENIAGSKSKPNPVLCFRLSGAFDCARLDAALRTIVAANPDFYSTVRVIDATPWWSTGDFADLGVDESAPLTLVAVDTPRALPHAVQRAYESERVRAFDLQFEFPIRLRLLRCGAGEPAYLTLSFHPLVMTQTQLERVAQRLESALTQHPMLPALRASEFPASADARPVDPARLAEFTAVAAGARSLQSFPTDRMRDAIKDFSTCRHEFDIDGETLRALGALPRKAGDPDYLPLLAIFAFAAGRYAQQRDVYVCTLAYEAPNPCSVFEHTVVKAELAKNMTFAGLMQAMRRGLDLGHACRGVSLEALLDAAAPLRSMSYAPYCQIAFEYRERAAQTFRFDATRVERCHPAEPKHAFSHSEILFAVHPAGAGGMRCAIEYSVALFERETIVAFAQHLHNLLDAALAAPDRALDDLDLMTCAERSALLAVGGARTDYPALTLDALFAQQAANTPDAIAVVSDHRHVSFAQLARMAGQLAARLLADGIGIGDRVGLYFARSPEFVVSVLAVLRIGAVYVPLDTQCSAQRIRYLEANSRLKCVLHARDDISAPRWKNVTLPDRDASPAPPLLLPPTPSRSADDPAYVIYTSGSTGQPKGVIGTHRSVVNRVWWARGAFRLQGDDVFCMKTNIAFVDHVAEMFQPLLTGGSLLIVSDDEVLNPAAIAVLVARRRVTRLTVVPFMLSALLRSMQVTRLDTLRSVVCSGDVLSFGLARRFFKALPHTRLFNLYGLTEGGADSSCYEIAYDSTYDLAEFFRASQKVSLPPQRAGASHVAPQTPITRPDMTLERLKHRFANADLPARGVSVEDYLDWLNLEVLPYVVNVSSSKFIGHMTSALPDFMSELSALVSRLNQNMVKVETSKSLTLLERQLLAMLHKEFFAHGDYDACIQDPDHVFGLVVSGGSSANITALWNARNHALMLLGFDKSAITEYGAFELLRRSDYDGFAIITSRLAHYSIRKAASLLGVGERNVLFLKQDARQKADVDDLQAQIAVCRGRRLLPIAIVGIAGATETGVIDPLAAMGAVAARERIHFHVDAAWGGAMIFSEKYRALLDGIERADSITLCPHKQLYVPQGISLCLFRDSQRVHASSVQAAYQGRQGSYDFGQYTIEGSRPAIFLSLHAMLSVVSRRGIGALVEQGIEKVRYFAQLIAKHPALELVGSPEINILNYRYIPRALRHLRRFSVEQNREISAAVSTIQQRQFLDGKTFVSRTELLNPAYGAERITVFRVVIANPLTTHQDLLDNLSDQLEIADVHVEANARHEDPDDALTLHGVLGERLETIDRYSVPIGQAIANSEILILDTERRLLPAGIIGEIYVGGDGLSIGYIDADDAAQAFVAHPFVPGARLFRTGDFGRRLADGNIEYCGRRDQQVKVRGMRVELAEVEANLTRLADARQCVVLAEPKNGDTRLVAFVVSHALEGQSATAQEKALRRQLIAALPLYMVPEAIQLVPALPLTASGKIDRQALKERLLAAPERAAPDTQSSIEARLRDIWRRILEKKDIHVTDDFFEVGGHSLAVASLQDEISREFSVELSLQSLFEHPRLDDIAMCIEEKQAEKV